MRINQCWKMFDAVGTTPLLHSRTGR